jgi:hypothetical protein
MSEGMRTCGLLLLAITLSVTGEPLRKKGMCGIGALDLSPAPLLPAFWRVFTPPVVALGLATPLKGNRSLAFPMLRIRDLASLFAGALVLNEQAPPVRVAGAGDGGRRVSGAQDGGQGSGCASISFTS